MSNGKTGRPAKRKVFVSKSNVGRGVFSNREFVAGEEISRIRGDILTDSEYGSTYCMDFGDGRLLEPAAPFRFLNHSCEPNCELVIWVTEDSTELPNLCIHAILPITAGDELTIDYGWCADAAVPCQCGRPTCRGWIVSQDELPLVLERRTEPNVVADN